MKDIWNTSKSLLKSLFISIEFIYIVILFLIRSKINIFLNDFGNFIFLDSDMVKYIALGLPLSLLFISSRFHKSILQPRENNKILYQWPDYKYYKLNSYVGLVYCIIPIIPIFLSWMYKDSYEISDVGFYYLMLVGVSIISTVSMYIAHLDINEYLDTFE